MAKKSTPSTITQQLCVRVFSPYQVFYDGPAQSLSANNIEGRFDILYDHVNFFSLLEAGEVTISNNESVEPMVITIQCGFIKVADNSVTLFANI